MFAQAEYVRAAVGTALELVPWWTLGVHSDKKPYADQGLGVGSSRVVGQLSSRPGSCLFPTSVLYILLYAFEGFTLQFLFECNNDAI